MKESSHQQDPEICSANNGKQLDLGISALIEDDLIDNGAAPSGAGAEGPMQSCASVDTVVSPALPQSDYESLAKEAKWHELGALCEMRISQSEGGDLEAKLWWIRCQLRMNAVPASILVAPLDSASQRVIESCVSGAGVAHDLSKHMVNLTRGVLVELGEVLKNNGEMSMALLLLERAYRIDSAVAPVLLEVVCAELKSMEKQVLRREDRVHQETMLRLKALKKELMQLGSGMVTYKAAASNEDATRAHNRVRIVILSILLLFATAVTSIIYFHNDTVMESSLSALEVTSVAPPSTDKLTLERPELDRLDGLGELDAVFYEMRGAKQVASKEAVPSAGGSTTERPFPQKEVINTSGPRLSENNDSDSDRGPDGAAGNAERRAPYAREEPGRLSARSAATYSSRPMAVENFKIARELTVITQTEVMSKPSRFSVPLDELRSGDRVHVEARVGPWLRLRSKQGRVGYVNIDSVDYNEDTGHRR